MTWRSAWYGSAAAVAAVSAVIAGVQQLSWTDQNMTTRNHLYFHLPCYFFPYVGSARRETLCKKVNLFICKTTLQLIANVTCSRGVCHVQAWGTFHRYEAMCRVT